MAENPSRSSPATPSHPAEAGSVTRRLWILAVVGDADEHLDMPLGLHGAAHHAEAHHRRPVLRDKARDDRVVGTLVRPDLVRMSLSHSEIRAPIL